MSMTVSRPVTSQDVENPNEDLTVEELLEREGDRESHRHMAAWAGLAVPVLAGVLAGCSSEGPAVNANQSHGQGCVALRVEDGGTGWSSSTNTAERVCSWVQYDSASKQYRGYAEIQHGSIWKDYWEHDDTNMNARIDKVIVKADGQLVLEWDAPNPGYQYTNRVVQPTDWLPATNTKVVVYSYGSFKDRNGLEHTGLMAQSDVVDLAKVVNGTDKADEALLVPTQILTELSPNVG